MEYDSELKPNELSSHEKTWWNVKFMLLSERGQSKRATYYMTPIVCYAGKHKAMETVRRSLVTRIGVWGEQIGRTRSFQDR